MIEKFKTDFVDEIPEGGVRKYNIVKAGVMQERDVEFQRSNANMQDGSSLNAKTLNEITAFLNELSQVKIVVSFDKPEPIEGVTILWIPLV